MKRFKIITPVIYIEAESAEDALSLYWEEVQEEHPEVVEITTGSKEE